MNDKKDIFEILKEFPENQEPKTELLDEAKLLAIKLYGEKKRRSRFVDKWWKILIYALLPCIIVTAIVTPILLNNQPEPPLRYFSGEDIVTEDIDSISSFLSENKLSFKYFSLPNSQEYSSSTKIKSTGEHAFLQQNLMILNDESIEMVTLFVVSLKDEFEAFLKYKTLTQNRQVKETLVNYNENQDSQGIFVTDAKFKVDGIAYYLTIQSGNPDRLEYYLGLLLN